MSKRASGSSSPSKSRKRSKTASDSQSNLHNFFISPSKKILSISPQIIDVDALDVEPTAGPSGEQSPVVRLFDPKTTTTTLGVRATRAEQPEYAPLTLDPVLYEPSSQPWTSKTAPYSFLAHTFTTLSQTRSRITIIDTLTNTLRTILEHHPPSLLPSLYLLSNTLAPPYSTVELGIGSSVLSSSIQQVSGLSAAALKRLYNNTGDVGDVAFAAKSNLRTLIPHPPLTIPQVYDSLLKIAHCKGQGAAKQKGKIVEKLLVAGNGEEVRYLVRTLSQNLRVGAVRTSMLTSLARAMVFSSSLHPQRQKDDSFGVSPDLLSRVKQSANTKKKNSEDSAREELRSIFSKAEGLVKEVYVRHPCYDTIVSVLLDYGLSELASRVPLTVGIPLHPTLGSPTRSLNEIYDRLGNLLFSAEFKYDGQRAQIHARKGADGAHTIKIFSRHLEDMTTKYPDVISLVELLFQQSPNPTSFIMDSEIVAIDPSTSSLKSFQELSTRPRKDVQLDDVRVPVCVFAFDLMLYNDEPLLARSFRERRTTLRNNFSPIFTKQTMAARFDFVESCESEASKDVIEEFWQKAVESRCEGLMIKLLDYEPTGETNGKSSKSRKQVLPATYEPDKRTAAWLKLKKDYVDGVGDSLDLVPIGAWYGNGRKAGWWSPILLGVWNSNTGRVVALCKCMSGFSDAFYKSLSERYPLGSDSCSLQPLWECDMGGFTPEVYFKPQGVWEIRGADITESPVSVAAKGIISAARGLSLRFPRFIRVRSDKNIEQASTPRFVADMWRSQHGKRPSAGVDDGDLVDIDMEEIDDFEIDEDASESD